MPQFKEEIELRQIKKGIRAIVLGTCMMFMFVSVTAFATNVNQNALPVTDDNTTVIPSGPDNTPELTDLSGYELEFVEDVDTMVYTGSPITPAIKVYPVETENEEDPELETETSENGVAPVEEVEPTDSEDPVVPTDPTEREALSEDCYTVKYVDNVNTGTAKVVVTGNAEAGYKGEIEVTFVISQKDISGEAKLTLSGSQFTYAGKAITPGVTVTLGDKVLTNGTDYDVVYAKNNVVGTATVIATPKGNYTGEKLTANFSIGMSTPSISSVINYNQVKVSWSKVVGASGYEVVRSTSKNSGYKTIASVSAVSYTDKSVKFNKTFYYKVRAYSTVNDQKVYSAWSSVNTSKIKPGTPTISKVAKSSTTALKVTWKKVSGASGYELYRATSKNGKYSKVTTIKKGKTVSYTDKKRSCGKVYYYKVRAYRTVSGKKYYGSYSPVVSGFTTPGKVSWSTSKITMSTTSVTLKWKKVSEATGYEIFRSTSKNSGYKKVKTISKNSTLSWKNTGLTKNTKYYYRIRAYKKSGKNTAYGAYSSAYLKDVGGWKYVKYDGKKVKLYYNGNGKLVKDVSNLIGKQDSYVIKINKRKNTVTVYAKDGKNGYIIPVKSFICSTGAATPLGTFKTPQKIRWHELDGPSYGQWCTRITGHILFHSVWYYKPKNTTLSTVQYNKLGTQASHGCVRLTAGDAKWIYDNCKLKTKVIIYNSSKEGPLGKPTAHKLKSWHTWDPTDPNMKSKCKSKGCH